MYLIAIFPGARLQHRVLGDTRLAPRCPEVEHDWLAAQSLQVDFVAVQILQYESRRRLTNEW
jgi:hypothetical protein